MSIAEKLVTVAENMPKVYRAGQDSTFCESEFVEEGVTGNGAVTLLNVSPREHVLDVKILGKNLATAQQIHEGNTRYEVVEFDGRTCVKFVDNVSNSRAVIPFKPNTQYTVSFDARVVKWQDINNRIRSCLFTFFYSDGTSNNFVKDRNEAWEHCTFTSTAGKTVVGVGNTSYDSVNFNYIDINSFQLEEGATATPYAPYIEDFSGVKVKVSGANLLDIHNRTKGTIPNGTNTMQRILETDKYYVGLTANNYCYDYNITLAEYVDGVWRISNKGGGYGVAFPVEVKPNTSYYLTGVNGYIAVGFYDKDGNFIKHFSYVEDGASSFLTPANCAFITVCLVPIAIDTIVEYSNVQLEVGTTATEYEPYKEPATYAVNADGTVNSVKSISPTTTLVSDTDGVIIDATYTRRLFSYDIFWDNFQQHGKRTSYQYGFSGFGWTDETFRPKYDIKPTGSIHRIFARSSIVNIREALEKSGVVLDTSNADAANWLFDSCTETVETPHIVCNADAKGCFCWCHSLKTASIEVSENTTYDANTFYRCDSLENLTVTGTIGQNGINLQWSTKLSHDSLMSIVNALADKSADTSGTTWTVTLGNTNIAKLTDAEKQIANDKGWYLG